MNKIKCFIGVEKIKKAKLQTLKRQFELLKMEFKESINEYFTKVISFGSQMKINGDMIEDLAIVKKILRTLKSRFGYVVVAFKEYEKGQFKSFKEHWRHMNRG